jgi:hypothetical protein
MGVTMSKFITLDHDTLIKLFPDNEFNEPAYGITNFKWYVITDWKTKPNEVATLSYAFEYNGKSYGNSFIVNGRLTEEMVNEAKDIAQIHTWHVVPLRDGVVSPAQHIDIKLKGTK